MVSLCQCHKLNKHVNDFLFSFENMLQEIAVNYGIYWNFTYMYSNKWEHLSSNSIAHNLWHFPKYTAVIEIRHILV